MLGNGESEKTVVCILKSNLYERDRVKFVILLLTIISTIEWVNLSLQCAQDQIGKNGKESAPMHLLT